MQGQNCRFKGPTGRGDLISGLVELLLSKSSVKDLYIRAVPFKSMGGGGGTEGFLKGGRGRILN